MDQRHDPSGASPGREDATTRGCILPQLMGLMLMILTELHERGVLSNDQNEEPGHNTPDLQAETQSEARDREHEGQGPVAEQPSKTPPGQISGDDRVGEDEHDTVKSKKSRGECPCCGVTLGHADLSQMPEKSGKTGQLGSLHSRPVLPRGSIPSMLPWKPPPPSMTDTRFVRDSLLESFH